MNRRDFLKRATAGAAGVSILGPGLAGPIGARVAPSDTLVLGVIGVGSRGKHMMRQFLRLPGVRIGALCDVYPPRLDEGRQVTGEPTPGFDDHRSMLEASPGLDAVLVATPLSFHAEHVLASLERGLAVYGEKALAFTVEECHAVADAVKRGGQRFQIGHQYRYAPWYRRAVERIARGEIGEVTHVYGYWHRNYNWRRPVPDPALERLINWRLYREYSGGLLAELGSHHIDVANWIFGEVPISVVGSGGIDFYPDGREVFDNVQAIFDYPSGGTLFFSSLIGNHKTGYQLRIYGTGGTVELTLEDGFFYYEPIRPSSAVPQELIESGVLSSATLATSGDMPYRGPGLRIPVPEEDAGDPDLLAAAAFIDGLRNDEATFADVDVGVASAVPLALGNQAIRQRRRVDVGTVSAAAASGGPGP